MAEDLRHGAAPHSDDRGAAGECFDHDEAEGLVPCDRIQQRPRAREQARLLVGVDFAEILDAVAEERHHLLLEVQPLGRLAHLGRDAQRHARCSRDPSGSVRTLVG